MPAAKHSTYQGIDITIDVDGEFRAIVDGKALRSGSLKSLKTAGRHGRQVTMIHGHDKGKHAVEVEQKMVEFLGDDRKANAPLDSRAIGDNELIRGEP